MQKRRGHEGARQGRHTRPRIREGILGEGVQHTSVHHPILCPLREGNEFVELPLALHSADPKSTSVDPLVMTSFNEPRSSTSSTHAELKNASTENSTDETVDSWEAMAVTSGPHSPSRFFHVDVELDRRFEMWLGLALGHSPPEIVLDGSECFRSPRERSPMQCRFEVWLACALGHDVHE